MDASELDSDVKLQTISADLLADFDRSLPVFLRRPDGQGAPRIRSRVKTQETLRLTNSILDSFQELPQLLDPHLPKWIPFLSEAYLEFLQTRRRPRRGPTSSQLLVSVDYAICKILYTFCKIRGEKVIVRFLNAETKYLELLLSAIEDSEVVEPQPEQTEETSPKWSWEQRYIALLWLSHLLLAPFDLSTISSVDLDDVAVVQVPGLAWPESLPGITMRVVPLAIKYLASPGKERDAAKALLVRVAMRRDMQQLGVLDALVQWALSSLRAPKDGAVGTTYFYLGVISFLAGMLRSSSDTSDMDRYLTSIFHTVHAISIDESDFAKNIVTLALARKMVLKVLRSVITSLLRRPQRDMVSTELTETGIGYMLDSLSDNDTPVRFAASKSLSIITLKLDPEMASQVVEAVLESLNRNVLWRNPAKDSNSKPTRDLSAVNNLEWHGLMLTLSHLLYRRSPPARQLADIIHALLLGLSFEQRGTSGSSIGSNVRDAACFGIWALARRYSTQELKDVSTQSVFAAKSHPRASSILQVLGTELVTTASLDPAGNIRRGASAALQELIGRHPDTIEKGIEVVQTVDYHAVARRSRAMQEVAINAAKLSAHYGDALMDGMLRWRGVGDIEASSRRVVGNAFGDLTAELASRYSSSAVSAIETSVNMILAPLKTLEKRQVEERHGLLLCLAAVIDQLPKVQRDVPNNDIQGPQVAGFLGRILGEVTTILHSCQSTTFRRPELVAEAVSQLAVSILPVLQVMVLPDYSFAGVQTGGLLLSPSYLKGYMGLVTSVDTISARPKEADSFLTALQAVVPHSLAWNDVDTMEQAATAALTLLIFSNPEERLDLLTKWADVVRHKPSSRASVHGNGYFYALAMAQPLVNNPSQCTSSQDLVCTALIQRWKEDSDIETRVAILQSLRRSRLLQTTVTQFFGLLNDGLNDFTTNARGDVGSHVRVEALRAVQAVWRAVGNHTTDASVTALLPSTLRLCAEKLDRVRPEAQAALALAMQPEQAARFRQLTFSAGPYFETLLGLFSEDWLHPSIHGVARAGAGELMEALMSGYVTSADTGNEDLVIASRAALSGFCSSSPRNLDVVCAALLQNMKSYQGQDRVLVPTMEIIAFLFHAGLFQQAQGVNLRQLCLQAQKAGYKSGNVRKIVACIKVYGGVASVGVLDHDQVPGAAVTEARRRLGALMLHPWPRVRSAVVDELWGLVGDQVGLGDRLTGVDWAAADKTQIKAMVEGLGFV
ncbi:Tubulin-specific chaperone D [Paramyrothecium foliicola]|nr:Tubulin-specific chaperone D [Paramyrothecium foliicola]